MNFPHSAINRRTFLLAPLALLGGCAKTQEQAEPDSLHLDVNLLTQSGQMTSPEEIKLTDKDVLKLVSIEGEGIARRVKLAISRAAQ